ncbi:hypothetical protein RclHR1_22880001 [Rhizophagus clarus]|nr:hypothetical protein RclHR1_22880001 [Rhizophagus clarus]
MIIIIWSEILKPLLRVLVKIASFILSRRFLNYKSEPNDPEIRLFVPPHIPREDFERMSNEEQCEIINSFIKEFRKKIAEEVQREIEEGILTDEMIFENSKLFEPCDFCSPQDCECTYKQYKARMEKLKKEVIVVI